jgi:hypothetical protein
MNKAEHMLVNRIYLDQRMRSQMAAEIAKRPDVALNRVILAMANLYIDGVRDGAALGPASRKYFTDDEWAALERVS